MLLKASRKVQCDVCKHKNSKTCQFVLHKPFIGFGCYFFYSSNLVNGNNKNDSERRNQNKTDNRLVLWMKSAGIEKRQDIQMR